MKLNRAAWDCLTADEQSVLSMIHGFGKSSWEVGQMMAKSHYKFLEIKYRAERFLKMFTEHIDLIGSVIPDYLEGNEKVIRYFQQCLESRMKPMEAIDWVSKTLNKRILKTELNQIIVTTLRNWEKSEDATEITLFHFIKEFDRWNNFRILPKEIQEPSAFKRRIKNIHKRHIKLLHSIPEISLNKLITLVQTKRAPYLYLPIIYKKEPQVIKVKVTKGSIETLNGISYYLFKDLSDAETYISAIDAYMNKAEKDCKDGLDFWPVYREIIKKANNYNEIQRITPSRKYLEVALEKLQFV